MTEGLDPKALRKPLKCKLGNALAPLGRLAQGEPSSAI